MPDKDFYKLIKIDTWEKLKEEYTPKKYPYHKWSFRGQEDSSWPLKTTFERLFHTQEKLKKEAFGTEYQLTREFVRRAHHYLQRTPSLNSQIEWLALMQHHKGPTRLLDLTSSFYIALHFALNNSPGQKSAIWAIDLEWVTQRVCSMLASKLGNKWADAVNRKDPQIIAEILTEKPKLVLGVTPFYHNERLTIQQGTFLAPGDVSASIEENFINMGSSTAETQKHIVKFEIYLQDACMKEALEYLHMVNITKATLFPGLDGFSESLHSFACNFDVFQADMNMFEKGF